MSHRKRTRRACWRVLKRRSLRHLILHRCTPSASWRCIRTCASALSRWKHRSAWFRVRILDVKVNTVFRANTSEALRQAIESGLGIGGMQLPLAARAVQSGRLVPVLPAWRLPDRFLYAVYPDARFIPRGSEALSAPSNPYCLTLRAISEGETFALGKSERETVEAECEEN